MGSFGGHAVPGTFFAVFGFWYIVNAFRRYYWALETRSKFKATAAAQADFLCGRCKSWPVDSVAKILSAVIGTIIEIVNAPNPDGSWAYGNFQHMTMYVAFGLSGAVELMVHYRLPVPDGVDYLSLALALVVEGVLFKYHLMGRTPLDVLVHTLLVYVIFICVVVTLLEMAPLRHHVMAPVARGYFLLLQGTWFWQVGSILYPVLPGATHWKEDDHEQLMLATMIFAWHAGANFIVTLIICLIIARCYRQHPLYQTTTGKEYDAGFSPLKNAEDGLNEATRIVDEV